MNALRLKLRNGTHHAHKRLDQGLASCDLSTRDGLIDFLSVQYLARTHIAEHICGYEQLRDDDEKLADLKADFAGLGIAPPRWADTPPISSHHALGYAYVLAGSSLGGRILYQNWASTTDPAVRRSHAFITNSKCQNMWRQFTAYITSHTFNAQETEQIVQSAISCFEVFEAANAQISRAYQ